VLSELEGRVRLGLEQSQWRQGRLLESRKSRKKSRVGLEGRQRR
jgi:hypothetical protein